jgi:glycine/D-amino acid oxidase-like deaminating enzyme
MAEFPSKARVVIVGLGGIVGASVAHHLVERGWDDIVGIDKSGVPTDIGSTAHASDFCYMTSHDFLSCWSSLYSIDFYSKLGHYERIGGLEVARVGDDGRMDEIKRKVASAKAFGTRARLVSPAEIKKKFPLIEEDKVQGGLWDPDAGLVIPRSQTVAGKLVEKAESAGKLKVFAHTAAKSLVIENGRIKGVVTDRGTVMADYVVVCAGLWGRLIAGMAGEDLPVMPVDHPLCFFGPYNEFANTGKEIGWPLLRDQGNSAYMRDTGDPTTAEGGMIEWGYYEEKNPRLVHPRDLLEKEQARLSPSQRDLEMDQIIEPLERAIELTPILAELGYEEEALLQRPASGDDRWRPVDRRKPEGARPLVCRRHLGEGRPRHGQADRRLDDRRPHADRSQPHRLLALLSAHAGGEVHRRPLRRGRAQDLQPGGPSARTL